MKKLLVSMLLISSTMVYAQYDVAYFEKLMEDFTTSLQAEGIDSYLVSERYCMGSVQIFQMEHGRSCITKGTYHEAYVFFEKDDKQMLKKIDNCGNYVTLLLSKNDALPFLKKHKGAIKENPVKKYEIAKKDGGPKQRTAIHPCFRELAFKDTKGVFFEQKYNLFDLTNEALEPNLNYEYNQGLKALELEKLIDEIVDDRQNDFRRE